MSDSLDHGHCIVSDCAREATYEVVVIQTERHKRLVVQMCEPCSEQVESSVLSLYAHIGKGRGEEW